MIYIQLLFHNGDNAMKMRTFINDMDWFRKVRVFSNLLIMDCINLSMIGAVSSHVVL